MNSQVYGLSAWGLLPSQTPTKRTRRGRAVRPAARATPSGAAVLQLLKQDEPKQALLLARNIEERRERNASLQAIARDLLRNEDIEGAWAVWRAAPEASRVSVRIIRMIAEKIRDPLEQSAAYANMANIQLMRLDIEGALTTAALIREASIREAALGEIERQPYYQVVKYLNEQKLDTIRQAVSSIQQLKEKKAQLLAAVTRGDYESPAFRNPQEFPYIAFICFKEGTLTREAFSTICFYYGAWQTVGFHPEMRPQVVHYEPCAPDAFLQTPLGSYLAATRFNVRKEKTESNALVTSSQAEAVSAKMGQLDRSQQVLFTVADTVPLPGYGAHELRPDAKKEVSHEGFYRLGVNLLGRYTAKDGSSRRIIPSFGLLQSVVGAIRDEYLPGEPPLQPLGVLGLSTRSGMISQRSGREVMLPFPGLLPPNQADDYSASSLWEFVYHDLYHVFAMTFVSPKMQELFIKMFEVAIRRKKEYAEDSAEYRNFENFEQVLADMEYSLGISWIKSERAGREARMVLRMFERIHNEYTNSLGRGSRAYYSYVQELMQLAQRGELGTFSPPQSDNVQHQLRRMYLDQLGKGNWAMQLLPALCPGLFPNKPKNDG